MKKTYLILAIILLTSTISVAQKKESNLHYGVKAGINLSLMGTKSDFFYPDVTICFNGGFKMDYQFAPKFSLNGELIISTQNYRMSFVNSVSQSGEESFGELRYNTINLSVPITLMFNIVAGLHVEVGAQYSFKLSAKQELLDSYALFAYPSNEPDVYKPFNSNSYNRSDIAAIVGASYRFTDKLALNLRYIHGFLPVIENVKFNQAGGVSELYDMNLMQRSLQLSVEYRF